MPRSKALAIHELIRKYNLSNEPISNQEAMNSLMEVFKNTGVHSWNHSHTKYVNLIVRVLLISNFQEKSLQEHCIDTLLKGYIPNHL